MKTPCNPVSEEKDNQITKMNKLATEWATPNGKYKNIAKRFDSYDAIENNIKTLAEEWLGVPYTENFYLTDKQWKKLDLLSKDYNNTLGKKWKNYDWFDSIVPEGISLKDPTARAFHLEFNDAWNYERTALAKNSTLSTKTATYLREAYLTDSNVQFGIGTKAVNKVRELQGKIMKSGKESDKMLYMKDLEQVVASDNGKILRDFTALNEMSNKDFNIAKNNKKFTFREKDVTQEVELNINTINAAENSRKHLFEMGKVLLDGITKMDQLIDLKYDYVLGDKNSNSYKNLKSELSSARIRIEESRKKGGYLPRYFLDNVIDMKVNLDKIMNAKYLQTTNKNIDVMAETLQSINSGRTLDSMKPRNEMLNNIYNKDPLYVIEQYGKEVTAYNKLATLQKSYIKAMKDIGTADTKFVKGLKTFINEQYTVATKGLGDRPQWVNDMTRTISAVQIARTMGLNFTGAIKNTSSAVYFMAEMGYSKLKKSINDIKYDEGIKKALDIVEKEQGYLFPDVSRELVAQGLLPAEGIRSSDIEYDPLTNKINYKGNDVRTQFEDAQNWSIDKLLFLHRITENLSRNWMFKTAFASKYRQLREHPEYMINVKKDGDVVPEFSEAQAKNFAKNYAIKMVNLFAYEYAIHAKSRSIRGQAFKVDESGDKIIEGNWAQVAKGTAQQLSFQLMHYPMSLLQTHQRKLKGAVIDFKAGDVKDSENFKFIMRYAGIFGGLQLASIALNIDLNNIVENDFIRRAQDLNNIFNSDDEQEENKATQFGLLSQFTGPTISTLSFLMQVGGIIDTEESELQRIMFGNVDYDDPEAKKLAYYQIGTFPGQVANKLAPALKNGRGADVWRHLFKQYPSAFTKKWNQKLYGRKPKKRESRSKKVDQKILQNALKSLQNL